MTTNTQQQPTITIVYLSKFESRRNFTVPVDPNSYLGARLIKLFFSVLKFKKKGPSRLFLIETPPNEPPKALIQVSFEDDAKPILITSKAASTYIPETTLDLLSDIVAIS